MFREANRCVANLAKKERDQASSVIEYDNYLLLFSYIIILLRDMNEACIRGGGGGGPQNF